MIERIDISEITKDLAKDLKKFERDCIPKAQEAALLRVGRSAIGRWVKAVGNRMNIKHKLIRARSSNRPLGKRPFLSRMLTINGAPMPVSIMGPKGRVPKQTKKGVRIAGRHYPRGFVARARFGRREGGQSIFERDGEARGPISEARISIDDAVKASGPTAVRRAVNQRYPKEFEHALDRCLKSKTRAR